MKHSREDLHEIIRSEHICLSSGYSFRFMGHESVSEILH